MSPDHAEAYAVEAFTYLAGDEELILRFAEITGVTISDMATATTQPGFLVGVLDFFLANEADLIAFSEAAGKAPEQMMAARHALAPTDISGF